MIAQKDGKIILCQDTFHDYAGTNSDDQMAMAAVFIDTIPTYFAELQQAYVTHNQSDWHDTAHKMKGMAAFAGAELLRSLCLHAQNNSDMAESEKQTLLMDIQEAITLTIAEFQIRILKEASGD